MPSVRVRFDLAVNDAGAGRPARSIHAMFGHLDERLAMQPFAAAIVSGDRTRTYAEYHADVVRLAARIAGSTAAGCPVGIHVSDGIAFATAIVACAAAGAPFAVLDPAQPMIANVDARRMCLAAIVECADSPVPDAIAVGVPRLRWDGEADRSAPAFAQPAWITADSPLMIACADLGLHASAVVHSHRTLGASADAYAAAIGLAAADRLASIVPATTIGAAIDVVAALSAGACLVASDGRIDDAALGSQLLDRGVTVARVAPEHRYGLLRSRVELAASALRIVRIDGSAIDPADVDRLRSVLPERCRLDTGFETLEAGLVAYGALRVRPDGAVALGAAVAGSAVTLEHGMLRATGTQVAAGVWSGGSLGPGPFVALPGDPARRSFLSAELAHAGVDDTLFRAGRADRAIEREGRRLDAADIEAAIVACAGVAAAVLLPPSNRSGDRLRAVVVRLTGAGAVSRNALRRALSMRLPAAFVPGDLRFVDVLPYDREGAVDLGAAGRAVAVPNARRFFRAVGAGLRPDALARAAVETWSEMAGTDSVLANESWLDAGGDARGLLELAARIERRTNRRVAATALGLEMRPREFIERLQADAARETRSSGRQIVILPGLRGDNEKLATFRTYFSANVRCVVPVYATWAELVRCNASFGTLVDHVAAQVEPQLERGPIALVGHSFGGLVAHELGRVLLARGYNVDCVAILDTDITYGPTSPAEEQLTSRSKGASFLNDIRTLGFSRAIGIRAGYHLANRVYRTPRIRRTVAQHRARLPLPPAIDRPFEMFIGGFVREEIARAWKPRMTGVATLVFRSRYQMHDNTGDDLGWRRYANVVGQEIAGGTHLSMICGRHGERLARRLEQAIGTNTAAVFPGALPAQDDVATGRAAASSDLPGLAGVT